MQNIELLKNKKHWYKRWWGVILIVLIPIFATFLPLYIYQLTVVYKEIKAGTYIDPAVFEAQAPYKMEQIIDPMSPWLGHQEAPIKIVEFGDFNCPYCKSASGIVRSLVAKYPDKIQFYWRNFPVTKESSVNFALAGVCSQKQSSFWAMHDQLFQKQGAISIGSLNEIGNQLGLDVIQFEKCLEKDISIAQIRKDYLAAEDLQIAGTPTFFINGIKLQGVLTLSNWEEIINKLLLIYE